MKEFIVNNLKFRVKEMSATEVLGLRTVINFSEVDKAKYMFDSILERLEVQIVDVWVPVKEKDTDNYTPVSLKEDYNTLYEICGKFMKEVLIPLFQKSEELKNKQ